MRPLRVSNTARKTKSADGRIASLEKELRQIRGLMAKWQERVEELQSRQLRIDETLQEVDTRIEESDKATANLFAIIDQIPFDHRLERTKVKTGLGILVDQGGAAPVNANAARAGGGTVYTKGSG